MQHISFGVAITGDWGLFACFASYLAEPGEGETAKSGKPVLCHLRPRAIRTVDHPHRRADAYGAAELMYRRYARDIWMPQGSQLNWYFNVNQTLRSRAGKALKLVPAELRIA